MTTTSQKDWLTQVIEADKNYYDEKLNEPGYKFSNKRTFIAGKGAAGYVSAPPTSLETADGEVIYTADGEAIEVEGY